MLRKKANESLRSKKSAVIVILSGIIIAFITSSNATDKKDTDSGTYLSATQSFELNPRKADTLPLLSIMTRLERDVNIINAGIWRHDFQMIKKGAGNIAHHPKIAPEQVKLIKDILGSKQFKEFVNTDKMVHQKSVLISDNLILSITTELFFEMERGCISCHVNHRNKIVTSDNW